jgi:alcohol dehydrogenase
MMSDFETARYLLRQFKGDKYLHGLGVLPRVGQSAARLGRRAALVRDIFSGSSAFVEIIEESLAQAGIALVGHVDGAAPNAPLEDLGRITQALRELDPDVIASFGGGSTIDATKAAEVLRTCGGDIEDYFGVGKVSQSLQENGKTLTPHVAIQTAASSGAHLTKYSNITNVATGQKKLVVDEAIVPAQPVFDYAVTFGAPSSLTADGALDGLAHSLEVLYGAVNQPFEEAMKAVGSESIRLVVKYLPLVLGNPHYAEGREALGLATDLGGYAIMLGGTNGGHLTSFSLVDVLSHGRACALMNPYYTVFFAPAIEEPLRLVGRILKDAGYSEADIDQLRGRELGIAVARALIDFQKSIGFPTTLSEVVGFSQAHIERALTAAKSPQLRMKLQNMPVSVETGMVDEYLGAVLQAAVVGDLELVRNVKSAWTPNQ